MRRILLLAATTALLVEAQGSNAFGSDVTLCNGSFADANATGKVTFNPEVFQGPQEYQPDNDSGNTLPITLVGAVVETSSSVVVSTWINTAGANYSDDFGLGYDVCAFNIQPLPYNDQLRAQNDNGSCHEMFDQPCVEALNSAAEKYALQLTSHPTPPPNSNLTSTSLPTVCNDIATMMSSNLPKSCSKYFQDNTTISTPTALTGYNGSSIYNTCFTNTTGFANSYWLIQSESSEASDTNYDNNVRGTTPILAVWMPIANVNRPSTISNAKAGMLCLRPDNVSPGSRKPAALPAAKPVGGSDSLSGGAIAGIVVGVIVGLGIIGGLAVWWFLRRRKAAKVDGTVEKNVDTLKAAPDDLGSYQSPGTAVSELPPDWLRPELSAERDAAKFELPEQNHAKELMSDGKNGGPAVELEGTIPGQGGR